MERSMSSVGRGADDNRGQEPTTNIESSPSEDESSPDAQTLVMERSMPTVGPGAGDNRGQEPSTTNIQSLPSEILPLIFVHLSAEECKNVRLTCKTWYEHSYTRIVMQKQKFVITEDESMEAVAEFLLRSTHIPLMNLEFRAVCINALTLSLWMKCGHQIHSLFFTRCQSDRTALVNISLYCVNLTSLQIIDMIDCGDGGDAHDESDADSLCDLTHLARDGVKRTKLREFLWFHSDCYLPLTAVKQFFLVFPCLTSFGLGPKPAYHYQLSFDDYQRRAALERDEFMYANFDECLDSSMPLEKIVYNRATDGSWMTRSILKPEWSCRLIELQTLLRYENLPDFGRKLFFDLFAAQKNLQIVTLNELIRDEALIKDLMFCIFEHCPNLRRLQLRLKYAPNLDRAYSPTIMQVIFTTYLEFAYFFSYLTKLECFDVNFGMKLDFPSDLLADLPSTSFSMDTLHLNQSKWSKQFCLSVLQRCSKLIYLVVNIVFDDLLQEIFKNTNLRKLQLATRVYYDPGLGTLTDYGFTGRSGTGGEQQGLSIKCLQKLEYLQLKIQDNGILHPTLFQKRGGISTRHSGVTVESIRELQLPRLKNLDLFLHLDSQLLYLARDEAPSRSRSYGRIKCVTELPGSIWIDLATNLPAIRILLLHPAPQDIAALLKMCEMSKHLSLLQCSEMSEADVDRVFDASPQLRYLHLICEKDIRGHAGLVAYHRDPSTKEIKTCRIQQDIEQWEGCEFM